MARYIDADKVMQEINRIGGHNLCEWETIGVKALIDRQPTVDVAPKSEVAKNALFELKKLIHNKAVYTNSQDIPNYIQLKVFDAILQNYINNLK